MTILFVGGEDLDFTPIASSILATASNGNWAPNTTAGSFRAGYARQSIAYQLPANVTSSPAYIRNISSFSASSFWTTARFSTNFIGVTGSSPITHYMRWCDSSGVVRLRISTTQTAPPATTFIVEKVNAAGTVTQIGSTSTGLFASGVAPAVPDKIDVFINYAVAGMFSVYLNGVLTFTFSGDVTTDGQTSLSFVDLGMWLVSANTSLLSWSEVLVLTQDTRNFSLVTQVAPANGNTHNWDSGTAANISATAMTTGDTTPNYATTAGLIQEYQITPAIPAGNFSVQSVVHKARMTIGASGPQHAEFMVRTGGADFTSTPDVAPTGAWDTYSYNWDTNPNTGLAWATTELVNASTLYNYGIKSIT